MSEQKNSLHAAGKDVLMSFGLLIECSAIVGDPTRIPAVSIVPEIRDPLLHTLLSTRDAAGKVTEAFNPFTSTITPEEAVALLDWAGGHVLAFFLNALTLAEKRAKESEAQIKALMPSGAGLSA